MSWLVTFTGSSVEVNSAFDAAAEQLRQGNPPVGEFEDLHQARTLVLAALQSYGCELTGTAHGYWVGVDFQAFVLSVQRYTPPADVQLPLPQQQPVLTPALAPTELPCAATIPGYGVTCGCSADDPIHCVMTDGHAYVPAVTR